MAMDGPTPAVGCYDLRGEDICSYFGAFTRRQLPESALCALSLAASRFPPSHIGYMAWITAVSGTTLFAPAIRNWAIGLGTYIHGARLRRTRLRQFCPGWKPEWGRQACLDGVGSALFGRSSIPSAASRAEQFGVSDKTYSKMRDFIEGSFLICQNQYQDAIQRVMHHSFRGFREEA